MRILSIIVMCFCLAQCRTIGKTSKTNFGDDFGNGTDSKTYAWFADPSRSVSYCIKYASDFGVSSEEFQQIFGLSLEKWLTYFNEHRTIATYLNAKKFVLQAECADDVDLTIYLGTDGGDDLVKTLIASHKSPSFAYLSEAEGRNWGKGLIWFAKDKGLANGFPDWKKEGNVLLFGSLLHQLGHVFGLGDVDETIMTSDLMNVMQFSQKAPHRLRTIEWIKALARPNHFDDNSSYLDPQHNVKRQEILSAISGNTAEGEVTSQLILSRDGTTKLVLRTKEASASLALTKLRDAYAAVNGGFTFRAESLESLKGKIGNITPREVSFDKLAGLASDRGLGVSEYSLKIGDTVRKVTVEFNRFSAPMMVFYHKDGKRYELFRSSTPYDLEGHNPTRHF